MGSPGELVLGLPRRAVPGSLDFSGVRGVSLERYLDAIREHATFRPRDEVETDPSWKQVIPYLALRDGDRIFLMRRTKAGADERLHDRYSIGIGGHHKPQESHGTRGARREREGGD